MRPPRRPPSAPEVLVPGCPGSPRAAAVHCGRPPLATSLLLAALGTVEQRRTGRCSVGQGGCFRERVPGLGRGVPFPRLLTAGRSPATPLAVNMAVEVAGLWPPIFSFGGSRPGYLCLNAPVAAVIFRMRCV